MADYYTLLTNAGIAYETACKAAGTPIKLTQISVGDGGGSVYNPAATATALKREVWRGPLNALFQDEKNPSWLLAEVTIPPDVGGWYVREAGLWTDTGVLYAIVKYPESFKPVLATSGSGKEFYIRSIFETSNASLVTLLIDDTVVKATRAWVMSYLAEELGKLDGKQSVRVAATANVVLSGAQQIDGVAVIAGDRVLLANQTLAKDNGLWIVANGDWVRATDANTSAKVTPGLTVMVEEGTANGDSLWHLTTNAPITLSTTALTFKMLAGRTGIAAGTYKSLTVDEYGRATAGANPETLAGFGIKDSYTKAEVEALIAKASALPVGSIVAFPVDAPPPGFLELDNSVKSSATYPDLSAYLGGKFNKGDEGVGNFRLPEARGEFLRGWDHGRGIDPGRGLGSLQSMQAEGHSHVTGVNDTAAVASIQSARGMGAGAGSWPYGAEAIGIAGTNSVSTNATYYPSGEDSWLKTGPAMSLGNGETRPRNIAVMWCIKAWNAPVNQGTIDVAALAKEVERLKSAVPVGAVLAFPTGIVAPGYLELDGSVQSIATYPDLAAFLGTTYNKGNEGAGNFRLPESRGEFLRGWDHGRGVDAGRGIGTWQADDNKSHIHATTYDVIADIFAAGDVRRNYLQQYNNTDDVVTKASGGAEARPRNIAVMWCIKAWNAPVNQGSIDIAALATLVDMLSLNGPVVGSMRGDRMSVPLASATATFNVDEVVVGDANGRTKTLRNFSKPIDLSAVIKGLGSMDVGATPAPGYLALYALYNPETKVSGIAAVNATTVLAPVMYNGGSAALAGFTFSALVSVWPTNANGQFVIGRQEAGLFTYTGGPVFVTTGGRSDYSPFTIGSSVPLNAKRCQGSYSIRNSMSGVNSYAGLGGVSGIGSVGISSNPSAGSGGGVQSAFPLIPLTTPQTLHYVLSATSGVATFEVVITGYTI